MESVSSKRMEVLEACKTWSIGMASRALSDIA